MKKILGLLTLLIVFAMGAKAQDTAFITPVIYKSAVSYNNCSSGDSILIGYGFINHGPDTIQVTDTFAYTDFLNNSPNQAWTVAPSAPIAPGDTFYSRGGYLLPSDYKWLLDTADSVVNPPYANGTYSAVVEWYGIVSVDTAGNINLRSDFISNYQDTTTTYDPFMTMSVTINCPATTAIHDAQLNKTTLSIFPNPAQNEISFKNNFAAATTTAQVRITDIAGRVVKTMDLGKQNAGERTFSIGINDLNNGMYYIELVTDHSRGINKFTKN